VGKSVLSREIARNPHITCPAFILRDDYGENQADFYRQLGNTPLVYTMRDWDDIERKLHEQARISADFEKAGRFYFPDYARLKRISAQVDSERGLNKPDKSHDPIAVFTEIVKDALDRGADFVCLDSLNAMLGDKSHFGRETIERIIAPFAERKITFLLIHHENKKGGIYGSGDLSAAFDNVYHLYRDPTAPCNEGEERLVLDTKKARFSQPCRITFTRRNTGEGQFEYADISVSCDLNAIGNIKPQNMQTRIMEACTQMAGETQEISFSDLHTWLGGQSAVTPGAVKNALKELEIQSFLTKADGKHWAKISIL
jgi:hypothetical protein